jgi:integrase
MSATKPNSPRRVRVPGDQNVGVYERADGKYEYCYRDSFGKLRWVGPFPTITSARKARQSVTGKMASGEVVLPAPKLTFSAASERWLDEQVSTLRPATKAIYSSAVKLHLNPRWGRRKLDSIKVRDAAQLVRELRSAGYAEWTIAGVLKAASRVFKFSARHLNWRGSNPIAELENGERAKISQTPRRRLFSRDELAQTITAAHEPFKTLFVFLSISGCRLSESLGLIWSNCDLSDLDAASVSFEYQADRKGERQILKTDTSRRTIEIPRQLASMLVAHRLRRLGGSDDSFVFATRTGRPLQQNNCLRELRRAMRVAKDEIGRPTFPVLHETDERGKAIKPPRGSIPNLHSMRHTAASEAIAAGESVEEVSWTLGHRSSNVTRAIYVHEVRNAERAARRRAKMAARMETILETVHADEGQQTPVAEMAEVRELRQKAV